MMIIITQLPKQILFLLLNFVSLKDLGLFLAILPKATYERSQFVDKVYQDNLLMLAFSVFGEKIEINTLEISQKPLHAQFNFFKKRKSRKWIEAELVDGFKSAKIVCEQIQEQKNYGQKFIKKIDEEGLLVAASAFGSHEIVKQFLRLGVDLDALLSVNIQFYTPLLIATQFGFSGIVQQLLQAKASPNISSTGGITPLILAAEHGHDIILKLLLEEKADLNTSDDRGNTPLTVAIRTKRNSTIQTLLRFKESSTYIQDQQMNSFQMGISTLSP